MKQVYPTWRKKIVNMFPLFLLLISLLSCSKNDNLNDVNPEDITQLTVSLSGIEEEDVADVDIIPSNSNTTSSLARSTITRNSVSSAVIQHDGFDAISTFENDGYKNEPIVRKSISNKASVDNYAAVVNLGGTVHYRILLYKQNGTFFKSQEAVSGTPLTIDVVRGDTYRWIAYSYNDASTVADVSDYNMPTIPTGQNRDVLYATGTITVSNSGNTPLGIVFKHRLNRIGVEINTKGMFADLSSASITLGGNYFKTGILNLRTGALTGLTAYGTIPTGVTTFVKPAGYTFNDRNVAFFYTADSTAISALQVTLNNFTINLDSYGQTGTGTETRAFTTASNYSFNVPATTSLGRSRLARIDLIESALTVAGVRWARSNLYLYQNSTTVNNPYRFYHRNPAITDRESYWPWHGLTPTGATGSSDPCNLVYPSSPTPTWRTPTPAELSALSNTTSGRTFQSNYVQYTSTAGIGSPYPSNALIFRYNGQSPAVSLLGIPLLSFGIQESGYNTYIWSDDPTIDLLNLLGVGVTYYRSGNRRYLGGLTGLIELYESSPSTSISSTILININLLGIDVLSSGYKNIRCVRNI
ncbi:hypothetical protein [Sphingobacterium sp. LRF_L2]|uniref:hypothetical protein n=1 Tax=Sphingobacterium sp. LRF_L2 TaxID=3369421 RepID=UPI003F62DF19